MKYFYNPPSIIKKIFSDFIWETNNSQILLTFDDGPIFESTEIILDILKEQNKRAVFFCVGNNVKKNPALANEIIEDGHIIGNHTFNHSVLTKLDAASISAEIDSVNHLLNDTLNYSVKYFRPPHGKFDFRIKRILKQKNINNVMWSLLTYDYKNDFNIVKYSIDNYLKANSIIVFHDSIKSAAIIRQSLDYLFEAVDKKGFTIGEPEECLNR
jgi:peptidoglycan/xylan/chitin deacetylase (PgdA/CDA1 family)